MLQYTFILGNNPLLSLAEIFNREAFQDANLSIKDITSHALVVTSGKKLDCSNWQNTLGGSVKIGIITQEFKGLNELRQAFTADNLLKNYFNQKDKKIIFGFSLYGDLFQHSHSEFNAIGLQLKNELKEKGFKGRFVAAPQGDLTSVQVEKNKLIAKGADILIIKGIHAFYLGKTITVQDFEDYSRKDYGRPRRDAKSGMLPPKIAKIMINLAKVQPQETILDPFCGSGTIIQEAMLLKIKTIIGSDISQKAISDTRQNISWLAEKFKLKNSDITLYTTDVRELNKKIQEKSIDKIVSEPYLGPPLKKEPPPDQMQKIVNDLEKLYLDAFKVFNKILKPSGYIAIIFPLFRHKKGVFVLRILEKLEQMGFKRINPIPEKVSLFARVGPTARGSLIYKRPDQRVEREIFIFQKGDSLN